jgi:PAS domain S-box-containing protein
MRTMRKISRYILREWRGYLLAIGLVALATWLKHLAQPKIIPADVPILYMLAIVPTAIFFGLGPSISVCILSLLAYDFFFIPPIYEFTLFNFLNLRNAPILVIFLSIGILISFLASKLRQKNQIAVIEIAARKQTEMELLKYKDHLEDLVKRRTAELEKANLDLTDEITERKKAEEALRESEQRWATTLKSIGDAVIATDTAGKITFMNAVAEALTGWALIEALGTPITKIFDIINEYTRQNVENPVVKILQQGVITGLANHTVLVRKDRTEIAIDDSGAPIKNETGNITGVVLIFRDITERKLAESKNRQLSAIVESSNDAIIGKTLDGIITSWNKGAEKIYGYAEAEVINKSILILAPPDRKDEIPRLIDRIKRGENIQNFETIRLKKDGNEIPITLTISPILDDKGEIMGASTIAHDITERKKAEDDLKRYTIDLEIANKELKAFSYSVSHDLRAPLRAIDGFSNALLEDYEDKLDEPGQDYLNRIRKSCHLMSQLIDDMLKLSRVSRAEMHPEEVNLSEIVRSIIEDLQRSQPERGAEFIISPEIITYGDRSLLDAMLRNLLENAWKFTGKCQQTRIEFGITHQDGIPVYYVKDNGIGFDMKYSDKLFKPFSRLHTQDDYPGTGIGLANVQKIVHRHGGRIWAEAELGKGATFYFTLGK